MKPPADACSIDVRVDEVFWLTRDERRDDVYLLCPPITTKYDWRRVHRRIFLGVVPTATPQHFAGTFTCDGVTASYVATVFLDAARVDDRDLPVVHRLVWFPPGGKVPATVPADWGPCLVAALAPAYDLVFKVILDRNRMLLYFYREALALGPEFHLVGPAATTGGPRDFALWTDDRPPGPDETWRPLVTWLLFWSGSFALIALVVFIVRRGGDPWPIRPRRAPSRSTPAACSGSRAAGAGTT